VIKICIQLVFGLDLVAKRVWLFEVQGTLVDKACHFVLFRQSTVVERNKFHVCQLVVAADDQATVFGVYVFVCARVS